MKKKSSYIAWIFAPVLLVACSDFLETPPSVDYGENEVFATRADDYALCRGHALWLLYEQF